MENQKLQPEPPYWLKTGDENWGPTDLRKPRESKSDDPVSGLPRLPRHSRRRAFNIGPRKLTARDNLFLAVVLLSMLAVFLGVSFWIERVTGIHDPAVLMLGVLGGFVVLLLVLVGVASIFR